ncbi:MAG TPA: hypothetical protein VE990_16720, partial [Acidimicrobiales bacterium]|nr:hypothetical protein [Acidimicrobiales bacterium]
PTTNLLRLFAAMGLEVDAAAAEHLERATASPVCSDATERIALSPEVLGRLGDRPILEPEGFGAGSPRDRQLTSLQQWQVESLTSDLMAEFGYERRHSKLGPVDSVASAAIRAVSPRLPTDLKRRLALGIHGYDWRGQHRAVMRNFGEIAGSLRPPRTRSTA